MALLKVEWTETVRYEAEIEVDGYDPKHAKSQIAEAILDDVSDFTPSSYSRPKVTSHTVVRDGELPPSNIEAPKHGEKEWDF